MSLCLSFLRSLAFWGTCQPCPGSGASSSWRCWDILVTAWRWWPLCCSRSYHSQVANLQYVWISGIVTIYIHGLHSHWLRERLITQNYFWCLWSKIQHILAKAKASYIIITCYKNLSSHMKKDLKSAIWQQHANTGQNSNFKKQVMQGCNIVADRWARTSKPYPQPYIRTNIHKNYLKCLFFHFLTQCFVTCYDFVESFAGMCWNSIFNIKENFFINISLSQRECRHTPWKCKWMLIQLWNKVGCTATEVACRWAGLVIKKGQPSIWTGAVMQYLSAYVRKAEHYWQTGHATYRRTDRHRVHTTEKENGHRLEIEILILC